MNLSRKLFIGVALTSLLLGGCTSKVTEREQYSGFLSNYNNLQQVTTTSGETAMRWVSPSWNPDAYNTVVFNKLELYPAPKPTERVNKQTLDELQSYMTSKAKGVLGQKYRVVSSAKSAPAGSKTLIMRAAITGVSAENEGMKWYEVGAGCRRRRGVFPLPVVTAIRTPHCSSRLSSSTPATTRPWPKSCAKSLAPHWKTPARRSPPRISKWRSTS